MGNRKDKVIRFWYHTDEEACVVQVKGHPIGKAHEIAIELLHEKGYTAAAKSNVKKVGKR